MIRDTVGNQMGVACSCYCTCTVINILHSLFNIITVACYDGIELLTGNGWREGE